MILVLATEIAGRCIEVAVPGWAVVTVAGLLAGPRAVRAVRGSP